MWDNPCIEISPQKIDVELFSGNQSNTIFSDPFISLTVVLGVVMQGLSDAAPPKRPPLRGRVHHQGGYANPDHVCGI
jgi:hypothetical protein